MLGLGAGNQDVGRNDKPETVKFALAGDVLNRLRSRAPGDGRPIAIYLRGGQKPVGLGDEFGSAQTGRVKEEQLGVSRRILVSNLLELAGTVGDGFAKVDTGYPTPSPPSRQASCF